MVLLVCTSRIDQREEIQSHYGKNDGQHVEVPLEFPKSQFLPQEVEVDSIWCNKKAAAKHGQMRAQALERVWLSFRASLSKKANEFKSTNGSVHLIRHAGAASEL